MSARMSYPSAVVGPCSRVGFARGRPRRKLRLESESVLLSLFVDTGRETDRHGVVVATAAAAKEDPGRPRLRPASSAAAAASRRPHRPPDLLHQRRREQQQCVQEGAAAWDVYYWRHGEMVSSDFLSVG